MSDTIINNNEVNEYQELTKNDFEKYNMCARCKHWRRIIQFYFKIFHLLSNKSLFSSTIYSETKNNNTFFYVMYRSPGICLKLNKLTFSYIKLEDASESTAEKYVDNNNGDYAEWFKKNLVINSLSYNGCNDLFFDPVDTFDCTYLSNFNENIQSIKYHKFNYMITCAKICNEYVKAYNTTSEYCCLCRYWREKPCDDDSVFATTIPINRYKNDPSDLILVHLNSPGYCLLDRKFVERKSTDTCSDFLRDDFNEPVFLPMISPKQRYNYSQRLIRSLITLNSYCAFMQCKELESYNINNVYYDMLVKYIRWDYKPLVFNPILIDSEDTIRTHLTYKNKSKHYDLQIMWRLSKYFNVPIDIIYAFPNMDTRFIDIYRELEISRNFNILDLDRVYSQQRKEDKKLSNFQLDIKIDEGLLYVISMILFLCDKSEVTDTLEKYEKKYPNNTRKQKVKEIDLNHIDNFKNWVIYLKGNHTIKELSLLSGFDEKKVNNMLENIDNYSEDEVNLLEEAFIIPLGSLKSKEYPAIKKIVRPFLDDDKVEAASRSERDARKQYLMYCLMRIYKAEPELTKRIIDLFKIIGPYKCKKEYKDNAYRLNQHLISNCNGFSFICGDELYDPSY